MCKTLMAALASLMLWCGFVAPAGAQDGRWLRAETQNFIIYYDGRSETQLRQQAERLEDYDATLRLMTGSEAALPESKLEIYLVQRDGLRAVWPDSGRLVRGFYTSNTEMMMALAVYSDAGTMDRETILFHEYAHHFMLHYFPDAYPAWYREGFAEYFSTVFFPRRSVVVGHPSERGASLMRLGMTRTAQILGPEAYGDSSEDVERFYATSWLITAYIINNSEQQQALQRYVEALGEGSDPVEAFEPAFGVTPEEFDRQLVRFANGRGQRLRFDLSETPPEVEISRLSPIYDDLLLLLARARALGDRASPEVRADMASNIERYASQFPDFPYAQRAMARAALLRDDMVGARAALAPALAANDNDAEAHYLMALAYMREAEEAEGEAQQAGLQSARRELVRGFRADPNYYPLLFLYAKTHLRTNTPMDEEQLNVLLRAFTLAPQVGEIRIAVARELMLAQRYDEAIVVLRPIMFSLHERRSSRYARALIEAARKREPPPDQPDDEEEGDDEEGGDED